MKIRLDQNQIKLRKRIVEILYKQKKSHIGSSLNSVDIIDAVYTVKKIKEKFVLSNGHSAAALYVVLEKFGYLKNPDLNKLGIHPDRTVCPAVDVSTGSLGQGLPIALGISLANRNDHTYCLISDGECAEGSIWETLRIAYEQKVSNLKTIVTANGWGAYDAVSYKLLKNRLRGFGFKIIEINGHDQRRLIKYLKIEFKKPTIILARTTSDQLPFLKDLDSHYYIMNKNDYKLAMNYLK